MGSKDGEDIYYTNDAPTADTVKVLPEKIEVTAGVWNSVEF